MAYHGLQISKFSLRLHWLFILIPVSWSSWSTATLPVLKICHLHDCLDLPDQLPGVRQRALQSSGYKKQKDELQWELVHTPTYEIICMNNPVKYSAIIASCSASLRKIISDLWFNGPSQSQLPRPGSHLGSRTCYNDVTSGGEEPLRTPKAPASSFLIRSETTTVSREFMTFL